MKPKARILAAAALSLAPALAWAAAGGTGLSGTAHDFSSSGGGVGLCTFCHTPHRAITTPLLWNHTLSTSTFSWDVTKTTAGTSYPSFKGDTYTGPSAKCLSCHDGTVAIGDIAWWNEGKPAAALENTKHEWPDTFNVGARDGVVGSMKGNHPVAMPYPFGNAPNTYNGVTTGAGATLTEWQANPLSNIRLFNDDGSGNISAGAVAGKTGIECSSCHDPHNKASVDDLFLRGTLAGSTTDYICLKCHVK
jgi:Doubled CXXCH motif (Paired_CXXCH_1)